MDTKHLLNFQNTPNDQLIQRFEKLVRTERKVTHLVLLHIAEIEERKIYAELGYDGMYSYLTRGLGYSEGSAYRRLQSARLLKQVPEVSEKVENGCLNLTQLAQVQKAIKGQSSEVAQDVLSKIENKNTFETQKVLAVEFGLPIQTHETLKPQADDSVRIALTFTNEQFQELEAAKNLLSHICPEGTWADVIAILAKKFNKKMEKPERKRSDLMKSVNATEVSPRQSKNLKPRKYISIYIRRKILAKAGHCCEYTDPKSKKKCGSRFQLELDHIQPVALGGSNEISNFRILCRTHNALAASLLGLMRLKDV